MKNCICLACGSSDVQIQIESSPIEYKGKTALIPHQFICCNDCGSETDNDEQSKESKRLILAFRKKVDGLLSGEEIKAIRTQLDINQSEAAKIFGGGAVAFSKYENDDVSQSEPMNNLLILARDIPEAFAALAKKAGVTVNNMVPHNSRLSRTKRSSRRDNRLRVLEEIPIINPRHVIGSWNSTNDRDVSQYSEPALMNIMGEKVIELSYYEVHHVI